MYEQIYEFYRTAILHGRLKSEYKMPSHRVLASELRVSKNTVLKSYEQLLAEGYLINRARKGLYVNKLDTTDRRSKPLTTKPKLSKPVGGDVRSHAVVSNNIIDEKNFRAPFPP